MSHPRLKLAAICGTALALMAGVASAGGALVEYGGIVLRADGGFQPRTLPRHSYAAIEFKGHVNISAQNGGRPLPLQQAVIEFDRDGRVSTAGLATCPPERVANASTDEARRLCRGAIVGRGSISVLATIGGTLVPGKAELTVFNAPPVDGNPAVLLHARTTTPNEQTYAIVAPIERQRGPFRYRVTIDLPPIAGGVGALTHIDAKIGRHYRAGGKLRSYVAARCSDNVLRTRGRFVFEGGLLIEGNVAKYCRQR